MDSRYAVQQRRRCPLQPIAWKRPSEGSDRWLTPCFRGCNDRGPWLWLSMLCYPILIDDRQASAEESDLMVATRIYFYFYSASFKSICSPSSTSDFAMFVLDIRIFDSLLSSATNRSPRTKSELSLFCLSRFLWSCGLFHDAGAVSRRAA
jgi:hypothetical protein